LKHRFVVVHFFFKIKNKSVFLIFCNFFLFFSFPLFRSPPIASNTFILFIARRRQLCRRIRRRGRCGAWVARRPHLGVHCRDLRADAISVLLRVAADLLVQALYARLDVVCVAVPVRLVHGVPVPVERFREAHGMLLALAPAYCAKALRLNSVLSVDALHVLRMVDSKILAGLFNLGLDLTAQLVMRLFVLPQTLLMLRLMARPVLRGDASVPMRFRAFRLHNVPVVVFVAVAAEVERGHVVLGVMKRGWVTAFGLRVVQRRRTDVERRIVVFPTNGDDKSTQKRREGNRTAHVSNLRRKKLTEIPFFNKVQKLYARGKLS